jgi:cell division protein FtsQ
VSRGANRRRVDRVPGKRRHGLARALRLGAPTVVALALLAAAAWGAYRAGYASDRFRVREIRFHGLARLKAEQLLTVLPVRRGDHLLTVDPGLVEATLRKQPWVAGAEVRRRFLDGALDVEVREHRAAALVALGGLYLADEEGRVFEQAAPGVGLDLPVVTGIDREAYLSRRDEVEQVLAAAVALARRWSAQKLDARAPISEIHVDPVLGTTVVTGDGTEIRLGQQDLDAKLSRLVRLLPALAAEPRKPEVIHLDNRRHPDWVAVRFVGAEGAGSAGPPGKSVR